MRRSRRAARVARRPPSVDRQHRCTDRCEHLYAVAAECVAAPVATHSVFAVLGILAATGWGTGSRADGGTVTADDAWTIAELSARVGVSVRNSRADQSGGVVTGPVPR